MMLVLSRRAGEDIVLTEEGRPEIRIVVLGWDRGKVRLGFEAGGLVTILRGELADTLIEPEPPDNAA